MLAKAFRLLALLVAAVLSVLGGPGPAVDRGSYTVPGLGARKQAVLAAGGTSFDLALAMLETERMSADYPYGDGKSGDAANFGIFKQNWYMIRRSEPVFRRATSHDFDAGAALNSDLGMDVAVLHGAQARWPMSIWFAGHRNGSTGLQHPDTPDIVGYRQAVYWIRDQIEADPANRSNDVRFWVRVAAI